MKQDDAQATHCGKIEKEDGLIDPYSDSIASVYQKYKAYILWPKIYFMHNNKRVIVEELVLDEELFATHKDKPAFYVISTGMSETNEVKRSHIPKISLLRSASVEMKKQQTIPLNPCIKTLIVKPEGKKSQSRDDFVKGYGK